MLLNLSNGIPRSKNTNHQWRHFVFLCQLICHPILVLLSIAFWVYMLTVILSSDTTPSRFTMLLQERGETKVLRYE